MKNFTTGQRLKELMKSQNLRQIDILNKTLPYQKSLGIQMSKSHLSNYVNERSTPDGDKMRLLATALGVTEPWLMGYETDVAEETILQSDGSHFNDSENSLLQAYRKLTQPRKEKVQDFIFSLLTEQTNIFKPANSASGIAPARGTALVKEVALTKKTNPVSKGSTLKNVITLEKKNGTTIYPNIIGAAAGIGTSHYADLDLDEIMIPTDETYESSDIIPLYVCGDSMEPKYFDGDVIWIDTQDKTISLHQIGVFDTESGRVVKKMGINELISINRDYPDIELHEYMDFSTYGKVIDVIRREQLEEWKNARWV